MKKDTIIQGLASIFGFNKQSDYKSLVRRHWKKMPGANSSEKLQYFLAKYHLKPVESAKLLDVSLSLISKILSGDNAPGIKFLEKIYNYEQNPKSFVHVCRICKKPFDRKGGQQLCPKCREFRNRTAQSRLKPKEYVCESCLKTFTCKHKRKLCDDCWHKRDSHNLYFSFMK